MEPNGDKRRGASAGPAVEQRNVPRQTPREYAGPHLSKAKMGQRARCPRRGKRPAARFRAGEMEPNGDKRRGFAVGAPARRSRDGNGKTSAPVGPMTGQPGFAAGEMRPNGSKGRGGNGSRVWEKRKASAFAGPITKSADGVTFLMLRK